MNTINHQPALSIIAQEIPAYTVAELFLTFLSFLIIPLPIRKIYLKKPTNILSKNPLNYSLPYICSRTISKTTFTILTEDPRFSYNPHSYRCFHAAPFNHVLSIMHSIFFNR
jgi:hypothetical protein